MNDIQGFTFYKSYYETLKDLSEKDKKEVVNAILEFVFEDKEPSFKGFKKTIWILIKPNLNTSKNKSKSRRSQNADNLKSNQNQDEIKLKSNEPQKEVNDLIEKDKEKDKDKDKDVDVDVDKDLAELIKYYEANIQILVPTTAKALIDLKDSFPKELIKKAIDIAAMQNARNMRYIQGILNDWKTKGYKCLADIEQEQKSRNKKEISEKKEFNMSFNPDELEGLYCN